MFADDFVIIGPMGTGGGAVQALIDAASETHVIPAAATSTQGVPPTAAEIAAAGADANDLILKPLADGTIEYWMLDANGDPFASPSYIDVGFVPLDPRVVAAADTIANRDDIVVENTAPVTLTVGAGVQNFKVGRSIDSTDIVTVVPPAGFTIAGDATGIILNEAHGPVEFTLDGTNYVVEVPGSAAASGGGGASTGITQAELDASHDVTEVADLASRPASPEIGDIIRQLDDQSTWKFTADGWEAIYLVPGIDTVLAVAESLTANRSVNGSGNNMQWLNLNTWRTTATNLWTVVRSGIGSMVFNGAGFVFNMERLRAVIIRGKDGTGTNHDLIRAVVNGTDRAEVQLNAANDGDYILGDKSGNFIPLPAIVNAPVNNMDDVDFLMMNRDNGHIRRTTQLLIREQDETGTPYNTYAQVMVVRDSGTGALSLQVTGSNSTVLTLT